MELLATKRGILGKKVRFLRRQGITPVHVFGHNVESLPLQCDTAELRHALAAAGMTRLISLVLDKAEKPRNVMVREVQRGTLTGELLHVDFYEVSLEERIRVNVPIVLVGESPALKLKDNFLAQELNTLTIECLPDEIPNSIELDLTSLTEAEQAIHVKDIALGEGIIVLNEPEQLVAKVSVRAAEKAVEERVEAPAEAPLPEKEAEKETPSTG